MKLRSIINARILPAKILLGAGLGLIIASYGLFEGYDFLAGPALIVETPTDGQIFTDPLIEIRGTSKRIAKIYLNGRQIFAEDDGKFSESLLLGYGYNIIEVKVQDQFGRHITKTLSLVLN